MTYRQRTHGPGCWGWGQKHYECAVREIERLRKMHQDAYQRGLQAGSRGLREMYDTIQAVKRQDAWDNTRLTEALMAAEERAERAEAENKRLRDAVPALQAENERLRAAFEELLDALRQIAEWPDGGNRYGQENIKRFAKAAIDEAMEKENSND